MKHAYSSRRWLLRSRFRRGMVLPLTGFTFFAMICFAGLALDTGHVYIVGQQLQCAADSAALAGAAQVQIDQAAAVTAAVSAASKNKEDQAAVVLNAGAGDVQVGNYDRATKTFTVNGTPFNAVKVTAKATTNLLFAPVVNLVLNPGDTSNSYNTSAVSRTAIAMAGGKFGAGVITLDPSRTGIDVNGNISLQVPNGGIQVNSKPTSVSVKGNAASIGALELRAAGDISAKAGTIPSKNYDNTTAVPDPLAYLPAPDKSTVTNYGTLNVTSGTVNASPGYYPGGISLKGNSSTLNLAPGVYIVGGKNAINVTSGTLNAKGVMFYVTTDAGGVWGDVSFGGKMDLEPPTSGTYKDVVLFTDRAMPYSHGISLGGNATTTLLGTVYMPSQPVSLQGTSAFHVGNQLIVATIHLGGTPDLIVDYDGRNKVTINSVFLVK